MNNETKKICKIIAFTFLLCIIFLVDFSAILYVFLKFYLSNQMEILYEWLSNGHRVSKGIMTNGIIVLIYLLLQMELIVVIIKKLKNIKID